MARDQVDEIKQKVDIVELIGGRVDLKKAGRHFKGLCPFHSEKTPSFIVSPERQSYKCFGCGEYGDAITFLQKYDGYSFLEALEFLAKKVGVTLESYRPTSQDARRKRILEALSLSSEYYHYLLTEHESGKQAREYLQGRGIGAEAIKQFNLGYAPGQWRSVSDFLTKKKGFTEDELEAGGVVIKSENGRYYDRFRGRIMFPLKDHKGVVVGFSGRVLDEGGKKSEAKYINSPETVVYSKSKMLYGLWENREAIRKADKILLVEGELDVIPSWQAGVKYVAAIKGSAFTEEQAQLIARYTRNVLMSLDADSAGQEAIKRAVDIAERLDLSIRVVQVKGGKDPGEVASSNPRMWREEVGGAVLYWDFLLDSASGKHDSKTGEGATAISREVVPALSKITNLVVRAHYVTELATRLKVPESSIYEELERLKKKIQLTELKREVAKIEENPATRREEVETYTLALALQYFETLKESVKAVDTEMFGIRAVQKIFLLLKQWPEKQKFAITELTKELPAELLPVVDKAYLLDLSQLPDAGKEWEKTVKDIESLYLREQIKLISGKIAEAEKTKDPKIASWQEQFSVLAKRLGQV